MRRIIAVLVVVAVAFGCGYIAGSGKKPPGVSFDDMIVNHPRDLMTLITPKDKRVRALAAGLKSHEDAYAYVRDRIAFDPSRPALPAGDILVEGRASCIGKAVLLCSLYRAMGFPPGAVRVVTGEVDALGGVIDHAWVDLEHDGVDIQQDPTTLLGTFTFDQFKGSDYTRSFIRKEGYVFNDRHFAVVSRLNLMKGMGHPQVP